MIADKQATHRGEKSEKVIHPKESEGHKPKPSASMMSDKKNLVLFATKTEMREVCENPSSVMHFVLVCKDGEPKTNTSHDLPLVMRSIPRSSPCTLDYSLSPKRTYDETSSIRH